MADETGSEPEPDDAAVETTDSDAPKPTENLAAKASQGFLWSLLGMIMLQVGSFITFVIAANVLNNEDLGIAAKVLAFTFWMDVLLDLGMGANIIYDQESGTTDRVRVAYTVNTAMALFVAGLIFFGAPAIASFFEIPESANLFRLLAIPAMVRGLMQIPDSMLRRDLNFKLRTYVIGTRTLLRSGLTVVFLFIGLGPASLVLSMVFTGMVALVLTSYLAKFKPAFRFDWQLSKEMLKYGLTIFGARAIGMLWLNGDYLVVTRRRSTEEFGDYWTAFRLPELLLGNVYALFSAVLFPAYSAAREKGAKALQSAYLRSMRLLWLYGAAIAVGLAVVARDFITVFFPTHPGSVAPMAILSLAGAFVALGFASGDLYNAVGKPRLGLYFGLIGTPILMGGFLLVVDRGIAAVALVHLIVIIPYTAFRLGVANHVIGTNWRETLLSLRAGTGAALGIVLLAGPIRLWLDAGIVSMLCIIVMGALGAFAGVFLADRNSLSEITDLVMKGFRHRAA